ncbi:MAG: zinc-binding alcohol dehydrogenase family protein [Gaiellales bacterium]
MRAARVKGTVAALADLPEPAAAEGEVVVEIEAAGLSPLDVQIVEGRFPARPPVPFTPGTDGCGTILAGDPERRGERVWIRGAGVGITRDGCWAERARVPLAAIHPLGATVDPAVAAAFFVPCSTAWQALFGIGGLEPGGRVAIRGAYGLVGSVATQLALAAGAGEVIAIVGSAGREDAAPRGATVVVAPDAAALAELAGRDVDILVDTVGGEGLAAAIPMLAPGGKVVVVGYVAGTSTTLDLVGLLVHDVSIHALNGMNREPSSLPQAARWLDEIDSGRLTLPLTPFRFAQLDEAIARVRVSPSPGRVVLTMR